MEVMVAVFILSMVLTAILSLVTYTVTGQQASEQSIIAQQLAREGIEVARNFRDSDALMGQQSSQLYSTTTASGSVELKFNPTVNNWDRENCSFCFWLPPAFPGSYQLFLNGGVYRESGTAVEGTSYARRLEFHHICRDAAGVEAVATSGTCAVGSSRIGTRVIAHVVWKDHAQLREVVLYDYLYDWK